MKGRRQREKEREEREEGERELRRAAVARLPTHWLATHRREIQRERGEIESERER